VYGNRGCLHEKNGHIRRRYNGKRWIACRLEFRGWHRAPLQQPGRFTELFFLDEATAFAAGHRPCALCRRADYNRLVELLGMGAEALDEQLHSERVDPHTREQLRHHARFAELPDGAFVLRLGEPWLVLGAELRRWTASGYTARAVRPRGTASVLTPPTLVEVLRSGWQPLVPFLHPSGLHPS
jgi:hypothetical protein